MADSETPFARDKVVTQEQWIAARKVLLEKEKAFTRARDELAAERRKLPWVRMERSYVFDTSEGRKPLASLFEGRRQLLIYHFWFQPGSTPCEGCSLWTSDLGDLGGHYANLHSHDTTLAFVSRASPQEIEAVRTRRNWTMPWYSVVGEEFYHDTGYDGWAQISVFVREDETVYLANVVPFSELTTIGNHWTLLERCPFGLKAN